MFVLYRDAGGAGWMVPFVRRRADLPDHPGQVALLDNWNNVVADDNTKVTVSINSGPVSGVLSGTLQRTMANGYATFSDLKISGSGAAGTYVLRAVDSSPPGSPHPGSDAAAR